MWDWGKVSWAEQLIQFVLIIGPIGGGWWVGMRRRRRLERWSIEMFASATHLAGAALSARPPDPAFCQRLGETIRERLSGAQDALGVQVHRRLEGHGIRRTSSTNQGGSQRTPTELLALILSQLDAKLGVPTDPDYNDTLLLAYGVGAYLELLLGHSGIGSDAAKTAALISDQGSGDLRAFKVLVDSSPKAVRDAIHEARAV